MTDNHAAFARIADASAKLFAEQAAAMAAMTAFGMSVAGQMTGLMLSTFKPAEEKAAETSPVHQPGKPAGTDGNVVPMRAKSERRDSVAEAEPKAEGPVEAAPKPEVQESKREARAEAAGGEVEVKPAEVSVEAEVSKTAPKAEIKTTARKIAPAKAAPKVEAAKAVPKVQAEERKPEPKARLEKGDVEDKPAKAAVTAEVGKTAARAETKTTADKVESAKAGLKAELPIPASKPRSASASVQMQTADDLKQISGIGPRLEKVLNGRGISTYAEIAGLSKAALKKIDDELGLEGRVIRDDWQGQAKALAAGGPDAAR